MEPFAVEASIRSRSREILRDRRLGLFDLFGRGFFRSTGKRDMNFDAAIGGAVAFIRRAVRIGVRRDRVLLAKGDDGDPLFVDPVFNQIIAYSLAARLRCALVGVARPARIAVGTLSLS